MATNIDVTSREFELASRALCHMWGRNPDRDVELGAFTRIPLWQTDLVRDTVLAIASLASPFRPERPQPVDELTGRLPVAGDVRIRSNCSAAQSRVEVFADDHWQAINGVAKVEFSLEAAGDGERDAPALITLWPISFDGLVPANAAKYLAPQFLEAKPDNG